MRAHPRVCGENHAQDPRDGVLLGSSPRVRGKRAPLPSHPKPARLIPARAGKTWAAGTRSLPGWAHPRACGENTGKAESPNGPSLSSPRVRGKHRGGHQRHVGGGLIRACGENIPGAGIPPGLVGSSPRVRGKRETAGESDCGAGLIPVCAGKTMPCRTSRRTSRAHPRVCGENRPVPSRPGKSGGSSPRVRGKPCPGPA